MGKPPSRVVGRSADGPRLSGAQDTDEGSRDAVDAKCRYRENATVDLVIAQTADRAGQTGTPHECFGKQQSERRVIALATGRNSHARMVLAADELAASRPRDSVWSPLHKPASGRRQRERSPGSERRHS